MRSRAIAMLTVAALAAGVPSAGAEATIERWPDAVGVFDPATADWYLRGHDGGTTAFRFGEPGDVPLAGDWDGDGVDGVAVYRPADGTLMLRDDVTLPISEVTRVPAHGTPVAADADGDGSDEVAVLRDGRLYLDTPVVGPDPLPILIGGDVDGLLAGDFDGDGRDEIAALRGERVEALIGAPGLSLDVGPVRPMVGDWDGDGVDSIGGYHPWGAYFTLFRGISGSPPRLILAYGSAGMMPVAGDFGDLPGGDEPPVREVGLPPLAREEAGPDVMLLQQALTERGLYRGPVDGVYGEATAYGVMALHKAMEAERLWDFQAGDWRLLADFELPPLPERPDEPDRVEVDIGHQLLFRIEDHEVADVVPVSTGGSYWYYSPRNDAVVAAGTPRGDFTLFSFAAGWHCDRLTGWCIYNPWSFTPYYALHGYRSVPEYPASHGCIRTTTWDSDYLVTQLFVGIPIHVWDTYDPVTNQTTP